MEYFDDHEFSYDMDTAQSEVKYDPRLLSQQLKNQHNHAQERAAPCYSATNKYTHGQRVAREDPCEVCLCVDGEIFCWWKKCGNLKRRKFKSEKSAKLGKLRKGKTIERIHKEQHQHEQQQQQLHLKQKKKLDYKFKQQQHNHQQQQQLQHPAIRNKILTFPENLPSVLYYDYKTEDQQHQHEVHHGNHVKLPASSLMPTTTTSMGGGGHNSANGFAGAKSHSRDENDGADDDDDDASLSEVGVAAEPISTEMKFAAKSHSTATDTSSINNSIQQQTTARIQTITQTTTTTQAAASTTEPFLNEHPKEDQSNTEIQYISGHPAGDVGQMLNMVGTRHPAAQLVLHHNHTTTMASQSQEVDHDGILRDGPDDGNHTIIYPSSSSSSSSSLSSFNLDSSSIKQNNEQQRGVGATSFRSSFNDFSSEFNASAAMDLALIISHHSAHNAPIILEADSIANASSSLSSSSSTLPKHELGVPQSTTNTNNSVLNTTLAPSTTVNPAQECIVMGASYKIGAILPQDTGNCLQCVCIEGTTTDDTPRVTCSPHNCPPLVLPDLFDATGY
ncbi:G-box-binding factor isoform X2 [Episyrphus balteatus]|nr:G-box-binding factor isoform X2 [Episyrphus balteatus]